MQTEKIEEITKDIKERYGINIRIFWIDKDWAFEPIEELTDENFKNFSDARAYALKKLAE